MTHTKLGISAPLHLQPRIRRHAKRAVPFAMWLEAYQTFAEDEQGFRHLQDIVECRMAPASGFDFQTHAALEFVTWMLEGTLETLDTQGGHTRVNVGEALRVTAGASLTHCEFNPSPTVRANCVQVWLSIPPAVSNPSAERRTISQCSGGWQLIASPTGRDGSLMVHSDSEIRIAQLAASDRIGYHLATERHACLQVITGCVSFEDLSLLRGDSAYLSGPAVIELKASEPSEVLLIDMS